MLPKNIKKLAAECRKAGIKTYKCSDFEFTLTEDAPLSNYKKRQDKNTVPTTFSNASDKIITDSLTEEQLLFWSSGEPSEEPGSIQE